MSDFKHLCLHERQRIERSIDKGLSQRQIADKLDRSLSSISYEITNNSVNGIYDAKKAHHKAYAKRKYSKIQCLKVAVNKELRNFVENNIADDQSPEGISGRIKHQKINLEYASAKAIYKFVKSPYGRNIEKHLYSKAVKKRGGSKRGKSISIDGRIMIDKRPQKVEKRREFGHFEGDFIESPKDGKGSLLVIVERKSRYPFIKYLENRDTQTVNKTTHELLENVPIKSLTLDNDLSFQKHGELADILDALVYFCHPHAPHEKGTVENRNKAIRRYVKRKSDLSQYKEEYFSWVESKLRNRYMKCLNFKTPKEVFDYELQKQKIPLRCGTINTKLLTPGVRIEGSV